MIGTFKKFLADEDAWEMFVEGSAGTGKTTGIAESVEYCEANDILYIVCAHTHKACDILRSKLLANANVSTLHAFLKKRPGINEHALEAQHIQVSKKKGGSERYAVMFVDEFSMIGEKDYCDIGLEQDPEYTGKPVLKVVYIGDQWQLPPINDIKAVYPSGKYQVKLTKVWRQEGDNPLKDTIAKVLRFLEKKEEPSALGENSNFKRNQDIAKLYKKHHATDMKENNVLLAFTNRRVEELNADIQGYTDPMSGDELFSPTTKYYYTFNCHVKPENVLEIDRVFDAKLGFNSKYKTLEHLLNMNCCQFFNVREPGSNEDAVFAVVFGHYQYKLALEELAEIAAKANKTIETKFKLKAKAWAGANPHDPLARARAKAWRDYMTFKDCVVCMDFTHALTVHKSQGSTFDNVFIDIKDLSICAERNYDMYLKLLYVAISRASNCVYTN